MADQAKLGEGQSAPRCDFDRWIVQEYADGAEKGFTALVLLLRIKRAGVDAVASTHVHVIGTDTGWGEVASLLAGAGKRWDGAVFFPVREERGGPIDETTARIRLIERAMAVDEDRLAINDGHFFDAWGRRMKVELDQR